MSEKLRHKRTSVTDLNYHFVWIVKRRKRVLFGQIAIRLEALLHEKAVELECQVLALEIQPEHIHLFINTPPTLSPDQIMFRLKGYSSRVLRQEFPQLKKLPSLWTRSYYAGTAGNVSSETIKRYIAEQSKHHAP